MKKVTRAQLRKWEASIEFLTWWHENCKELSNTEQLRLLVSDSCPNTYWAVWLIFKILAEEQLHNYKMHVIEQTTEQRKNAGHPSEKERLEMRRDNIEYGISLLKGGKNANKSSSNTVKNIC